MQPTLQTGGNRKKSNGSRRRVSFADHALVTEYETEEPTSKVQYQPPTQASLTGSDFENSFLNQSNQSDHSPPNHNYNHNQYQRDRTYSTTSSINSSNDDDILQNIYGGHNNNNDDNYQNHQQLQPYHNTHYQPSPIQTNMNNDDDDDAMDIEQDDININHNDNSDDNDMDLTANIPPNHLNNDISTNRRPSTTPHLQDMQSLLAEDDDDDTRDIDCNALPAIPETDNEDNNGPLMTDLLNEDDTISSIPQIPEIADNNNQSPIKSGETRTFALNNNDNINQEINNDSRSFNTETAHLQQQNEIQSTSEFNYNMNNNNGNNSFENNEQNQMNLPQNNGSFNQEMDIQNNINNETPPPSSNVNNNVNNNVMPALESPMQTDDINVNENNRNQSDSLMLHTTDIQATGIVTMQIDDTINDVFRDDEDEDDHTMHLDLPKGLLDTPTTKKQQQEHRRRRSSMAHNKHNEITATPPTMALTALPINNHRIIDSSSSSLNDTPSSNLHSSFISDSSGLGSATKVFRVDVKATTNIDDNDDEDMEQEHDDNGHEQAAQFNESFNTMVHNCANVLHEQYENIQKNQNADCDELRIVGPDAEQIRAKQDKHRYSLRSNDKIVITDDKGMEQDEDDDDEDMIQDDDIEKNKAVKMDWRDIASKYDWFPVIKSIAKYSLGVFKPMSPESNRIIKDPQEIVVQGVCDKVKDDQFLKLANKNDKSMDEIKENIKRLEQKMDNNQDGNMLVIKCRNNDNIDNSISKKCKVLREYCDTKCVAQFAQKTLQTRSQINHQIAQNYSKLYDDLNKLKQVYQQLNDECNQEQETINALKQFETNQSLTNLQNKIFENEKYIINEENRKNLWKHSLNTEISKREKYENDIKMYKEQIEEMNNDIDISGKYQAEIEEIASTICWLKGITGIQINRMTSSEIQLILLKWISFEMEYNYQTKQVYNIKFIKHKQAKFKDDFSEYLLNMVHSIGDKLDLYNKIKTLSDLKTMSWDIVQLLKGIVDLRANINIIKMTKNDKYKFIIKPLKVNNNDNICIRLSILNETQYNDNRDVKILKMKSVLMIDTIFTFKCGYPFNKIKPKICVILNRQIYDENSMKYESMNNRIQQKNVEDKICQSIDNKLSNIKLGNDLLIRCGNLIINEMENVLQNEANCVSNCISN